MLALLWSACALAAPHGVTESVEAPALEAPAPAFPPGLDFAYEPTAPGQITPDSPYWDLEVLYFQERYTEGEALARKRYAETRDPHLTLHIARFAYQRLEGDETLSKNEREAVYEDALAALDEGIAKDPSDMHLKFAKGVVLARLGTTRGVLASLRLGSDIESAWLEAAESDFVYHSIGTHEQLPCDAHLALGIFYRMVPDLWIVKALSGVRGSLDRSLEMHERGVACAGDRIRNLKELAVTQLCIGKSRKDPAMLEAGKGTIMRYLALTPTMEAEAIDIRHGALLLKDPSLACEYSRDGQQDLDATNLD